MALLMPLTAPHPPTLGFETPPSPGLAEGPAEFVLAGPKAPTPRARRAWVRALLDRVVQASDQAERTGQAVDLILRIRPPADPQIAPAPAPAAAPSDALDRALAAARERGAARVAEILNSPDMLSAREFAPLIGMSHETVNQKRKVGELLALQGATRGFRYPRWQVTARGLPLPGLPTLFQILGASPWTIYRFLLTHHNELSGATALEALRAGRLAAVIGVAHNISMGVFS